MLDSFIGYLEEHSIVPQFIDEEKTLVTFDVDNIHYLFSYRRAQDPYFFRIIIPNIASVNLDDTVTLNTLLNLSQSYKIGKAEVQDGQLWLCADSFAYSTENVNQLFSRLITVLRDMYNEYRRTVNG